MNLHYIIEREKTYPKVIFLDAMGTLFGLKRSIGEIYGEIAQDFGVLVDAPLLEKAFFQAFSQSSSLAFPNSLIEEIPNKEKQWWLGIVQQTFIQLGEMEHFSDFWAFFEVLYQYFASEQPWFVYPDVFPALEYWQQQGIELGIISNFDSRLFGVLKALNLAHFFESITLSSLAGAAKPHPYIFQVALENHQCLPQQAWHIGDRLKEDYEGALQAGLRAFLVSPQRNF